MTAADNRKQILIEQLREAQQLSGPLGQVALSNVIEGLIEYQDERNRIITRNVKLLIAPILDTMAAIHARLLKLEH